MNIEEITKLIEPILSKENIQLYDVVWTKLGKNKVLQISIMKQDGSMDLDTCQMVSEKVSEILDEKDIYEGNYMLEVCSPGAERKLKDKEDIKNNIGKHVYVKFKNPINNMNDVKGDLLTFENDDLTIEYHDKTRVKQIMINYENIVQINLAVKI